MNHLQHRIEVWEQKQATLDIMKEKMVLEADVADDEEDMLLWYQRLRPTFTES